VAVLEEARDHPASAGTWTPAGPLSLAAYAAAGTGQMEDADFYAELALEEVAGDPGGTRSLRAMTLSYAGRWAEAEPLFSELLAENPESLVYLGYLGWVLGSQGKTTEAREIRERVEALELEGQYKGSGYYLMAAISTSLGEHDRAIRELQEAVTSGRAFGIWTIWDPWFRPLHDDPRYQRLMAPR